VRAIVKIHITKTCPYNSFTDYGTLTLTIDAAAGTDVPEIFGLKNKIMDLAKSAPISNEQFTNQVHEMLPPGSRVKSEWSMHEEDPTTHTYMSIEVP
jgi:hypothetical protein